MDCVDSCDSSGSIPPLPPSKEAQRSFEPLSRKSEKRYKLCYDQYMKWQKEKKIKSPFSEHTLMIFFGEQLTKIKPTSLWSQYAMLRSTLSIHHGVNITRYLKLKAMLKQCSDGYQPKKSKTFTSEDVKKFLYEAPDDEYLFAKVALIFGIKGACRKTELCTLQVDDITDVKSAILVNINDAKTNKPRSFTITGAFYNIYKKYAELRPSAANHKRFFVHYYNNKCTRQAIGINKFGWVPKQIATYLNLKNPELYTGHCFRRSSATLLIDAGVDTTTLKQLGDFKSNAISEAYLTETTHKKPIAGTSNNHGITKDDPLTGITTDDFENICRTCMSREDLKPLYKKDYPSVGLVDMLKTCTLIKITEDDHLPTKICTNCIQEIKQAFSFATRCETTESILRKCLKNRETELANSLLSSQTAEQIIQTEEEPKIEIKQEVLDDFMYVGIVEAENDMKQEFSTELILPKDEKVLEDFEYAEEVTQEEDIIIENESDENDDDPADKSYMEDDDKAQDESYSKQSKNSGSLSKVRYSKPPFGCFACGKAFGSWTELKAHNCIHIHTGNTGKKTTHICPVCNKAFAQPRYLKSHMRTHTGEKPPHICSVCNWGFCEAYTLQKHMRVHTGEKPYSCEICSKRFAHNGDLSHHIKNNCS